MNKQLEISTLIGIVGAFAILAAALLFGSANPSGFFDPASILIVIGGTCFVTIACFTLSDFLKTLIVTSQTLVVVPQKHKFLASKCIALADISKREGLLSLEKYESKFPKNTFFRKYLNLIVDGLNSNEAKELMYEEIDSITSRHQKAVEILKKAAEVAPAMGLIGTLIGLVQMLGNLEDPSKIGPAMAIALLTTLYGAIFAFIILNPLANKLEKNSEAEIESLTLCSEGIRAIAEGQGALRLELKFNTMLSPSEKLKIHT